MEISVPVNEINTRNIFFGEKRKNIIVDGDFVKIVYSTDSFEMNGLYILIEFRLANYIKRLDLIQDEPYRDIRTGKFGISNLNGEVHNAMYALEKQNGFNLSEDTNGEWVKIVNKLSIPPKRNIILHILTKDNMWIIDQLCQIETEIVDRYIASNSPLKKASYVLKNQLLSGSIKYHYENVVVDSPFRAKDDFICNPMKEECILKISGVWETSTHVGITMKFILLQSCSKNAFAYEAPYGVSV